MNRLRGVLALALGLAGFFLVTHPGLAHDNPHIARVLNNLQAIDFSIPKQTGESVPLGERMEFYKIPGVSIALINDFAIEWEKGVGYLKAGEAIRVDEHTVFQTGSVSKFVTAVLVLHFVEKGMLDLDADVNRCLFSWKIPENQFTKEHKVTLRYLLSHQSGIPAQAQLDDSASVLQILSGEKPATNPPAVPDTVPGSQWNYSNIGYVVIQLILEDLTGKPFDQLAAEVIFKPLGMASSSFSCPLREDLRKHEAMPHATDGSPGIPEQSGRARTPGGLLSTPHDMATLVLEIMNAFLGKSDRVISPETARLMLTKQVDVPPEALGLPLGMGLGVFIDTSTEEASFLHPGHNSPGTTFVFLAYPALGKGAVIAANGNIGDRLYLEILASLAIEYKWPSGQPFKR
jgi:CubicO group peptidase (beta-lactamase class C family)